MKFPETKGGVYKHHVDAGCLWSTDADNDHMIYPQSKALKGSLACLPVARILDRIKVCDEPDRMMFAEDGSGIYRM